MYSSPFSRLRAKWEAEFEAWHQRRLDDREVSTPGRMAST